MFFLTAKRFKIKRLVIYMAVRCIVEVMKGRIYKIWKEGLITLALRKCSGIIHQPYICKSSDKGVVQYELDGKNYKFLAKRMNTSVVVTKKKYFILECKDGSGKREDITLKLQSWIGPNHDFHKTLLTPSDLGYKKLIVFFSIGDKIIVNENDPLPTNLIK
jgi:Family of unknown function (DUF5772)